MSKQAQELATQIKQLTDELAALAGSVKGSKQNLTSIRQKKTLLPKGTAGAIAMLKEEGYFEKPRELSAVINRLKEMGYYYQKTTISMNLLNMTKRRELIRFKSKETKNWEYVIRK